MSIEIISLVNLRLSEHFLEQYYNTWPQRELFSCFTTYSGLGKVLKEKKNKRRKREKLPDRKRKLLIIMWAEALRTSQKSFRTLPPCSPVLPWVCCYSEHNYHKVETQTKPPLSYLVEPTVSFSTYSPKIRWI